MISFFFLVAGLAITTVLNLVDPAAAQATRSSRDPVEIQRKVQRSAELQRQALQVLGNPGQADRLIANAYSNLKSAQDDMIVIASNAKTPDPLFNLNIKKADQALVLIQVAGDALKSTLENPTDVAREKLQQALRVTNTLLATGF